MKEHILIVEDEEDIYEFIAFNLIKEKYQVSWVTSGEEALAFMQTKIPDLLLLDLMLPGIDGFELCRQLKAGSATTQIPVIMVTAKGQEADIVAGLQLGADDYITKPFSTKVLLARIGACLRRKGLPHSPDTACITRGELTIDLRRHELSVAGKIIQLTYAEFNILKFLAAKPGRVYTRDQIVNAIHDEDFAVTPRTVDVQIFSLRKKIGSHYIETVRSIGYRFKE